MSMNNKNAGWFLKWPAPAKLNLMLRITGRRGDGYHLLQTVFQFVDLCDWLTFQPLDEDMVSLQKTLPGVAEAEDLTVRAAQLLKAESGFKGGVRIGIDKNIPMGGGLGGGSSDAATTLVVLNELWELGLSESRLLELGLSLGADVPVFVFGRSAWAEGVGECLQELELPEDWFVIDKPVCHVVTKDVFCAENLTRDSKSVRIEKLSSLSMDNDCLAVVRSLYPPVDEALSVLAEYGEARLTGTGACVFVQYKEKEIAQYAYDSLKNKREVTLVKGMNISPLRRQLNK